VTAAPSRLAVSFHAAWTEQGLGATFYVHSATILSVPDPDLPDALIDRIYREAAWSLLARSLGRPTPFDASLRDVAALAGAPDISAVGRLFVWTPALPDASH
jgi:hypothetical protein